jgi:hypothetical protein
MARRWKATSPGISAPSASRSGVGALDAALSCSVFHGWPMIATARRNLPTPIPKEARSSRFRAIPGLSAEDKARRAKALYHPFHAGHRCDLIDVRLARAVVWFW